MKKKKVFLRITKKAKNRYLIEERHTFLFFWRFYIKGSLKLKLPKYFSSTYLAQRAIDETSRKRGYEAFTVILDK